MAAIFEEALRPTIFGIISEVTKSPLLINEQTVIPEHLQVAIKERIITTLHIGMALCIKPDLTAGQLVEEAASRYSQVKSSR